MKISNRNENVKEAQSEDREEKLTINKLKTIIKNKRNQIKNLKLKMKTLQ